MRRNIVSLSVEMVSALGVLILVGSVSAAQVEIDAGIVPKPGDSIVVRVRFDKPMNTATRPSAELNFPGGPPQEVRGGQWNKDGTLWTFAAAKLGASKGLGRLVVRAAVAADGADGVVHEEPFVVGTEPILARLRQLADWIVARPHKFIFVEGYDYRTLLGLYEITGEKRYLELAREGADKLMKRQAPEGYWGTGYGGVFLADTGSALGLLVNLYKYATPDEQDRIDAALHRYVDLVLVRGDDKGMPFVHADGSLGVGFGSIKDGKMQGALNHPYTISTALTGAEVFAALYYLRGWESYKRIAVAACDWVLGTMDKDGVLPYLCEDFNPKGARREELWQTYRHCASAYVGEGALQAWTYIDDPVFRARIQKKIKPHIDWLVRTQNTDGSWGDKNTEVGLFNQARSHGLVNLLVWYHENVDRDPRVAAAVRRYYLLILDDRRTSYQHVTSANPVKSRYAVPLDYVATSLAGRALVEIIKPGADCYRWKDPKRLPADHRGAANQPQSPAAIDRSQLLTYRTPEGQERPVRTAADWAIRRRQIIAGAEEVMGKLPDRSKFPPLDVKVSERVEEDGLIRLRLTYRAEGDDRVPALLFLPKDRPATERAAAIVALHQTSTLGKGEFLGHGHAPQSQTYAKELAQRGYVVLAPDYPSYGDYRYDFHSGKYASGTMKGIVNHMRGVDLLQAREEVDPERIGAIGHSLGGHNALFLGVFDPRVKVIVSSCGWSPFRDSRHCNKPDGWDQDVYMPRIRTVYGYNLGRVPFDLQELVAALASRAFFSNTPTGDEWFAVKGVKQVEPKIREIFALLGNSDNFVVRYPDCGHGFPPEIRQEAYAFIDRVLHHTPPRTAP